MSKVKKAMAAKGAAKKQTHITKLSKRSVGAFATKIKGEQSKLKKHNCNSDRCCFNIGLSLASVFGRLPKGILWKDWLKDEFDFTVRHAQRLMKVAREYNDATLVASLGIAKAYSLLSLSAEERNALIADGCEINGEIKPIIDISKRDLESIIKERKGQLKPMVKSKVKGIQGSIQRLLDRIGDDDTYSNLRQLCEDTLKNIPAELDTEEGGHCL